MPITSFARDSRYNREQAELKKVVLQYFSRITSSLGSSPNKVALHSDDRVALHTNTSTPRAGSGDSLISPSLVADAREAYR